MLDEDQLAAQPFRTLCEPLVEQFLQLRVQRDVSVGVQLAQRHVQPVGRTDLHNGVGGQRQVLALTHAGSGEKLDGEPHERVIVLSGGLQQLGRRGVVEEPGQSFVGDRHIGGQHGHFGWRVVDLPFQQPDEEPAQRAESVLDRVPMQWCAAFARPPGQPALVGLDVCSTQVGDASRGRISLGDESGKFPQGRLDVFHSPGPQRGRHLLEVSAHCGAHPLGHLGPLYSADVCFGADSFTG
ncbi:MAG: hypothetical protein QJR12_15460 [Mycobacterium sp.]|nr:hypothetical protein [Mycobacterium sp.]MDI3315610.1 hypothetical protein [Mycobacterium sp.]